MITAPAPEGARGLGGGVPREVFTFPRARTHPCLSLGVKTLTRYSVDRGEEEKGREGERPCSSRRAPGPVLAALRIPLSDPRAAS